MTEENKPEVEVKEVKPVIEVKTNGIISMLKIGEVQMQSSIYEVDSLIGWIVWLLDQKSVKDYLKEEAVKKSKNGATFYD